MSKSEICAKRDGIEIVRGRGRGGTTNVYLIPCENCKEIIRKLVYSSEKTYYCDYCKLKIKKKEKILNEEIIDIKTKKEIAFTKATNRIEKQVKDFGAYSDAISLAARRSENYGSIPEAMVAIELVKLGYKVIPQQKIGKYRVDFLLKEQKVVIEVDGKIYHKNIYNGDREATIQLSLGLDWKIIHIPAELISKDIKKLSIIIEK